MDTAAIERIRQSFAAQSMMATLGAELAHVDEGSVHIKAPILAGSRQQQRFGHAGLTFPSETVRRDMPRSPRCRSITRS